MKYSHNRQGSYEILKCVWRRDDDRLQDIRGRVWDERQGLKDSVPRTRSFVWRRSERGKLAYMRSAGKKIHFRAHTCGSPAPWSPGTPWSMTCGARIGPGFDNVSTGAGVPPSESLREASSFDGGITRRRILCKESCQSDGRDYDAKLSATTGSCCSAYRRDTRFLRRIMLFTVDSSLQLLVLAFQLPEYICQSPDFDLHLGPLLLLHHATHAVV